MEARVALREVPPQDREWWSSIGEDYWQALLEQGVIAKGNDTRSAPLERTQDLVKPTNEDWIDGEAKDLSAEEGWQQALEALRQGRILHLKVSGANRGGLLVDWNGLQGFIPASHLAGMSLPQDPRDRTAHLESRVGDWITVQVIEVDREQNRLVFSEQVARSEPSPLTTIWRTLQPGSICQGTVTNLTSFGAFVDLGGVEGLIHISEMSWDRVRHPGDLLRPGQQVQMYVLGVNPEEKRIALSLKRLRPDPWLGVSTRYQVGEIVEGIVTNVVNFGAFVRIEEGLEGLIHVSELAEGNFLHPRNVVREGDRVRVRVVRVDPARHQLGLSLRQVHGGESSEERRKGEATAYRP